MNQSLTFALINNAALLLALSIVYEVSYLIPNNYKKFRPYLSGIIIGLICMVIMSVPFVLSPGLVFDTRSILISVTALTFGFVPALITVVMTAIFRISSGGAGLIPGVAVIVSSAAVGLLWRNYFRKKDDKFRWLNIYLFGFSVHVTMLLCMFTLPAAVRQSVISQIAYPVLMIYPVATVLLSYLLIHQKDRNESMLQKFEAEAKYKSLFENNHAVMLLIDPENGQLIDANPAAADYYGWSQTALRRMNISNINTLSSQEVKKEMFNAIEENRHHFVFSHKKADGSVNSVEVYSGPIYFNGRKMLYSIVHDITERMNAEKNLLESEQRFRDVVEGAPDAIYIQSKGLFVYLNQSAIQLFGADSAEQLIGTPIFDRYHPDSHPLAKKRMQQSEALNIPLPTVEKTYLKMDGTSVEVESTPVPITFNKISSTMIFARDISIRKQMERDKISAEAQLRQQQKLEAVGTLAGGVAHEINNPINGIMNYAQLVLDETDQNSTNAQYLTGIIHESKRISDIVKSLLQFSSQNSHSHSYARMDDIIHHTVSLIRTIIKKDQTHLVLDIEENLPDIKCRSQQIQQVLMNLLTNARDALNEKFPDRHEDKTIVLSCHQYDREGRNWFKIIVKDNGNGIPDAIRQKIFEPFFSTKPKEIGTGLGLSISFGIVKDHHGYLEVETELGHYTNFIVHLPVDNGWVKENLQESEVVS